MSLIAHYSIGMVSVMVLVILQELEWMNMDWMVAYTLVRKGDLRGAFANNLFKSSSQLSIGGYKTSGLR